MLTINEQFKSDTNSMASAMWLTLWSLNLIVSSRSQNSKNKPFKITNFKGNNSNNITSLLRFSTDICTLG